MNTCELSDSFLLFFLTQSPQAAQLRRACAGWRASWYRHGDLRSAAFLEPKQHERLLQREGTRDGVPDSGRQSVQVCADAHGVSGRSGGSPVEKMLPLWFASPPLHDVRPKHSAAPVHWPGSGSQRPQFGSRRDGAVALFSLNVELAFGLSVSFALDLLSDKRAVDFRCELAIRV